jgi:hypothetical protein
MGYGALPNMHASKAGRTGCSLEPNADNSVSFERLTSLSAFVQDKSLWFHNHIVRIYSPVLRRIQTVPETFTDGTQSQRLHQLWEKFRHGDGLALGHRMLKNLLSRGRGDDDNGWNDRDPPTGGV